MRKCPKATFVITEIKRSPCGYVKCAIVPFHYFQELTSNNLCVHLSMISVPEFAILCIQFSIFSNSAILFCSSDLKFLAAKNVPKISLVEIVHEDGDLRLRVPGTQDLVIEREWLEHKPEKEVNLFMSAGNCHCKAIFVHESCDEFVSQYLTGKNTALVT
jgi:hypothetical protein